MFAFFVYSIFFLFLVYLHFHFAWMALRRMRGSTSHEIDTGYVKIEDYFGQSFRAKLKSWIEAAPNGGPPVLLRTIQKGSEAIYVAGSANYPSGHRESGILVIEGDFTAGPNCDFTRELYVRDNCRIGAGAELQAVATDGALSIGENSHIRRWADSNGPLELRRAAEVKSRAVSRTSIELQRTARALSLFAPEVFTENRQPDLVMDINIDDVATLHKPGGEGEPTGEFLTDRLTPMGPSTYLHTGDLILTSPFNLMCDLVVRGNFQCGPESYLEGGVKAHGWIVIGATSVVRGNLSANEHLTLGHDSIFQGVLHARGPMRLCAGVRGLRGETPVAAYSDGPMLVEDNVVVNGKLSSAAMVEAVPTSPKPAEEPMPDPAGEPNPRSTK